MAAACKRPQEAKAAAAAAAKGLIPKADVPGRYSGTVAIQGRLFWKGLGLLKGLIRLLKGLIRALRIY